MWLKIHILKVWILHLYKSDIGKRDFEFILRYKVV